MRPGSTLTVQVVGTTNVVTWNEGDESGSAVGASRLQATKSIAREGRWTTISVSTSLHARVDTLDC